MESTHSKGPPGPPGGADGISGAPEAQVCMSCDYDLRGLPPDGNCPECGVPIAVSRDTRLCNADPDWLNRVANGAGLTVLGFIAVPVGLIAFVGSMLTSPSIVMILVALPLFGLPALGAFLFTSYEPLKANRPSTTQLARGSLGVLAVLSGALMMRSAVNPGGMDVLWLLVASVTAAAATAVAILSHASRLMKRVPARRLASYATDLAGLGASGAGLVLIVFIIEIVVPFSAGAGGALAMLGGLLLLIAAVGVFALFIRVTGELSWASAYASRASRKGRSNVRE